MPSPRLLCPNAKTLDQLGSVHSIPLLLQLNLKKLRLKPFQLIDKSTGGSLKNDILSGITVALALVPEAVAFAFVAGVSPIVGLYGAFMMGLITSIFGGRPGMISGATGAMAVVMVHLVQQGNTLGGSESMGLQYLFITLILAGVFQILAGIFRLGKFVRMIPHPVMMGFVNGLAIVIFTSQLGMFKRQGEWLEGNPLYVMIGLVLTTMFIIYVLPRFTNKIPAALTAIVVVSVIVILVEWKPRPFDLLFNPTEEMVFKQVCPCFTSLQ